MQESRFIDDILSAFTCVYTFEAKQRVPLIKVRVIKGCVAQFVKRAITIIYTLLEMMISSNYTPHAHSARFAYRTSPGDSPD